MLTLLLAAVAFGVEPESAAKLEDAVALLEFVIDADTDTAAACMATLRQRFESGEITAETSAQVGKRLQAVLDPHLTNHASPLFRSATLLAVAWRHPTALTAVRAIIGDAAADVTSQLDALGALASIRDPQLLAAAPELLRGATTATEVKRRLLTVLGRFDDALVGQLVLDTLAELDPDLRPVAIELVTQRPVWSRQLLDAIEAGRVPADLLNVNQIARLLASRDAALAERARARWGAVRTERNPQREQVIAQVRSVLERGSGNARRGKPVFDRVCGQCHRLHGQGQDVGPEITRNGRSSFDQLLSNVLDPSLVIGAAYQARSIVTADGRVLLGLLVEDNPQRVVLRLAGGKEEIVPRDNIDEIVVSPLSLMPEGLESQLNPQELLDLFAFITLDGPPESPESVTIPGTPGNLHR